MSSFPSKSFCVAPWLHAHVGANGNRRLCCVADEAPSSLSRLSWNEFKNSSYMKNIRKMMMNGVTPEECSICDNSNRKEVVRDLLNHYYIEKIPKILESTTPEGESNTAINYLDYRSNLCNLKCRTCDPSTSSTYQNFVNKQTPAIGKALFETRYSTNATETSKYFSDFYAQESLQLIATEEIDRIYFAGGEPVIEPNHLPFLEKLVESGRAPLIRLFYNTNLSYSQPIIESWMTKLRVFKKCDIFISLDGIDKVGEYIRQGSSFRLINRNVDLLRERQLENTELVFDITLTSLNLFFLQEFAEYALAKEIRVDAKLMLFGDSLPLLRPESIPEEIKRKIVARWKNFYITLTPYQQKLLFNLDLVMAVFESKPQWNAQNNPNLMTMLDLFESMYPGEAGFFELLKADPFGSEWIDQL